MAKIQISGLMGWLRYFRLAFSYFLFGVFFFACMRPSLSVYLFCQAKGQLRILLRTESIASFKKRNVLSPQQAGNLELIAQVKRFSVDSLGYAPSGSYTRIYDQGGRPILWVITASEPYELKAVRWHFPLIGSVTYKGFFEKNLAEAEYNHFRSLGYDVELRSVSAWSTLGWLSDPILSSMLDRKKGSLCNLIFHELFHGTYYAPGSVNYNENLASFIAHRATIRFLSHTDSLALEDYLFSHHANREFGRFVLRKMNELRSLYASPQSQTNKAVRKAQFFHAVADSILRLQVSEPKKLRWKNDLLRYQNAFFISYEQYDSMQDSLEGIFNNIYGSDVEKMVRGLKLKAGNY